MHKGGRDLNLLIRFGTSVFLCLGMILPVWAQSFPFKDVSHNHPAYKEIYVMQDHKIMTGMTYESFRGDLPLNRFQLAEALDALLGNRRVPQSVVIIITDINPNHQQHKKVSRVLQANLIEIDGGSFNGLRKVTRYELAQSLHRLLEFTGATPPLPREKDIKFRDIQPKYEDPVQQFANVWQITSGYPDGLFRGDRDVSRYDAAVMFSKVAALIYEDIRADLARPAPSPDIETLIAASVSPDASLTGSTTPTAPLDNVSALEQALKNEAAARSPSPAPASSASPSPSPQPSALPTPAPRPSPSVNPQPSVAPSAKPSPSGGPSASQDPRLAELEAALQGKPTPAPSLDPKKLGDLSALFGESPAPSASVTPSAKPSPSPTAKPSVAPKPTAPSAKPSPVPSAKATPAPKPTVRPSVAPSATPSPSPSAVPTPKPSATPTPAPTPKPISGDTLEELERRFQDLRNPSPSPNATVVPVASPTPRPTPKPEQPDALVDIPLPTPQPSTAATPEPSAVPRPRPLEGGKWQPPLRNRVLLLGNYRALYEERVPPSVMQALQMPATLQNISGDAGISGHLNTLFWFGEPGTPLGHLGLAVDLASLGGITFDGTDLTDLIWADLALMYKLVSGPHFDLALGLDGYFRLTDSSNDPRSNYFQAARTYMGFGMPIKAAYRVMEPLTLELTVAPHYVMQDLSNIALDILPLNRFDTQIQFLINWEAIEMGDSKISFNLGYQGLMLFDLGSEGSEMMHGILLGAGYHF